MLGGASNSTVTGTYEGNHNNAIGVNALGNTTTGHNNAIGACSNTTGLITPSVLMQVCISQAEM